MFRPIKIVFDSQIFCAQVYGGVSRYFCEIVPRLPESNADFWIKIVAPMYVNEYLRLVPLSFLWGFPVPQFACKVTRLFSSHTRTFFRLLGVFLGTIYINLVNPDIVHQTYFYPLYLFRRRTKKVLTIYDMIHEKFPSDFPSKDKTAKYKRQAALSADHVICISESTRRDVIEILGVDANRTSVIYLGFSYFSPSLAEPSELAQPCKSPYLLYVGQRAGYKNFNNLLRAYSESKKLSQTFNIICFGGGSLTADEFALMQTLGINRDTIIHLSGDDQLLGYLYKNASAFVYPSLYEGFGIPPLEAMSQGCPVVCSLSSSIPEVVGDAGEYFNPSNVSDIGKAIENVVFNEDRSSQLRLLGMNQLDKFSWNKCAKETARIYMTISSRNTTLH